MTLKPTMRKDWCYSSIPFGSTIPWCVKLHRNSSQISQKNNARLFVNGCGSHEAGMTLRDLRIGLTQLLSIGAATLTIILKVRMTPDKPAGELQNAAPTPAANSIPKFRVEIRNSLYQRHRSIPIPHVNAEFLFSRENCSDHSVVDRVTGHYLNISS